MREFGGIINFNKMNILMSDTVELTSYIKDKSSIAEIKKNNFYAYQLNRNENANIFEDKSNKKIVILNGRIDNRDDLIAKLNTVCAKIDDEELFYKSYLKWGNELGLHIIGSYVCIIFDYHRNNGVIIKDHIGSKPLYYSYINEKLIFSNNMLAINNSSKNSMNINSDRVKDYLLYIHGKSGDTFYKNIKKLQRAEILIAKNKKINIKKYFMFDTGKVSQFKNIYNAKKLLMSYLFK